MLAAGSEKAVVPRAVLMEENCGYEAAIYREDFVENPQHYKPRMLGKDRYDDFRI